MNKQWLKKFAVLILIIVGGFFLVKYIFISFSPFIIAAILASLINPIVNFLKEKIPINRGLLVAIVLTFFIAILVLLIIVGVSQIYLELNILLKNLPDYKTLGKQLQWFISNNNVFEIVDNLDLSPSVRNILNNNLQMVYETLRTGLINIINNVLGLLGKLPLILIILFLSFIATFFISRDQEKIDSFLVAFFPQDWEIKINSVKNELFNSAVGFIRAQLILITITGIITGIGLMILKNQYALIIAITSAILDLIPIIGPALIFYPWILYNLISGNFSYAIALFVVHTIMAAVRSGSEGKIMGKNLGIHPLSTMIALYAGYRIIGTMGFIIGPTILVVVKAVLNAGVISFEE